MTVAEQIIERLDELNVGFVSNAGGVYRRVVVGGPNGRRNIVECVKEDGSGHDLFVVPADASKIREPLLSDLAKLT